jgi:hypothetical protein
LASGGEGLEEWKIVLGVRIFSRGWNDRTSGKDRGSQRRHPLPAKLAIAEEMGDNGRGLMRRHLPQEETVQLCRTGVTASSIASRH